MIFRLFLSFIKVGLFSVGGGYAAIPLIQNQIVDVHHLMSMGEFADLITIAEMTPGPISINSATFVGTRLAGLPGAIICTIGCVLPAFIICLTLAHFYYKYRNFKGIQTVLGSLRPAVVALISSAGLSILTLALFQAEKSTIVLSNFRIIEFGLFISGIIALRKFKANPILVIFGSGFIGTLAYLIF
ncbi:MAG: chromate transporter [Clostridium sp.]|uniref:chromate transporter n=1 Tax=Clostridium sp. TaxID=1506 RepID=UPI00304B4FE2